MFTDEHRNHEPRTLVMEYTVHCAYRVTIMAGGGGVSRAIEDAVRSFAGVPNVDPASVRFRIEDANQAPC